VSFNLGTPAARAALLSICLVGYLFTGAPVVNAQTEETLTADERLENIEKLLAELREDLDNIHSTYVTREILEYEMSSLKTEFSALDSTLGTELSALRIEIYALTTTTNTNLKSVNQRLSMIWDVQLAVLALVLGTLLIPRLAETYKKLKT